MRWLREHPFARVLAALFLLFCVMVLAYAGFSGMREANRWVGHTHDTIETLDRILMAMNETEVSERGYLLTSDRRHLEHYQEAVSALNNGIARFSALTADNVEQQDRLPRLKSLIDKRLTLLQEAIALEKAGAFTLPVRQEHLLKGLEITQDLHDAVIEMQQSEERLLSDRQLHARRQRYFLAGCFVMLIALLGIVLAQLTREVGISYRNEQKLRSQTRILESILSSMGDGVAVIDADAKPLLFNPAAVKILGFSPVDKNARDWPAHLGIHEPDQTTLQRPEDNSIIRALHGQDVDSRITFIRNANVPQGAWVSSSARPLKDSDGKLDGAVAVFRDITEERRTHDDLMHSQAALFQAQKLEAIGRLAGGVAHDFNNLLTGILGICDDLLTEADLPTRVRDDIHEISNAGKRAASLTKQMLGFGRRQIAVPVTVNINTLVADLQKMLRRLIGEDIEMATALEPNLGLVKIDPGQIEQILVNLVLNARDAMHNGGRITIETANVEFDADYVKQHFEVRAGPHVMLAVSDTGVGMSPDVQAHIFEPFYTTKEERGTGLGLATVYGIVKQNNGDIFLYSTPGAGTTLKIYLPLTSPLSEGSDKRDASETLLPKGTETILLVEDEAIVRRVAKKALHQAGYKVLEAANAKDALEISAAFSDPIDLLLTDVVMPGMNGQQLASLLVHSRPEIKVLYMSGYTENVIVTRGILKPGIAFIEKSFRGNALARKVREVLDSSGKSERSV